MRRSGAQVWPRPAGLSIRADPVPTAQGSVVRSGRLVASSAMASTGAPERFVLERFGLAEGALERVLGTRSRGAPTTPTATSSSPPASVARGRRRQEGDPQRAQGVGVRVARGDAQRLRLLRRGLARAPRARGAHGARHRRHGAAPRGGRPRPARRARPLSPSTPPLETPLAGQIALLDAARRVARAARSARSPT